MLPSRHLCCLQDICLQATDSSACDTFKTCVKLPQLFALMSPGPAATDNDTGAKHAWQPLVLLFLRVAAATLNRGVGAKGASVFLPQPAMLLPLTLLFGCLQAHHKTSHEIYNNHCLCNEKPLAGFRPRKHSSVLLSLAAAAAVAAAATR